ncbi:MAG: hypothetical protein SCALA702_34270 [Melioribacteraceae bacterium]|nr:MAG: hypothetical protein SCALA702_34270 [Melioribacteraceae bacterium]
MGLYKIVLFLLSLTFITANISGTPEKSINFERISIEDGLSESTTFSIIQDHLGFMWFGTNDGLNKYDGYNFTVFKPIPGDSTSLSGNRIFKLFLDSDNKLWIGTDNGLNCFIAETNTFQRYLHSPEDSTTLSNNYISEIFEDSFGNFWVGTNNGLNKLERSTGKFKRYMADFNDDSALIENHVWTIFEDSQNRVWLGTDRGINRYIHDEDIFERHFIKDEGKVDFSQNTIFKIYQDSKDQLWVGTLEGLQTFDPENKKFYSYRHDPTKKKSLSYNNIWCLFEDSQNNFWVGTLGGGLNLMDEDQNFSAYRHNLKNRFSLSSDYVWSIYEDRAGILWIGTDIGINKYDPGKEKFNLLQNKPYDDNSLINNEIHAILVDSKNYLWVGTRAGLNRIHPGTGKFDLFRHDDKNKFSISNNYIRAIFEDSEGTVWIGTNGGGLNKYSNGRFYHYLNDPGNPQSLSENKVIAITEDENGFLWLGTLHGINKFDKQRELFTKYINNPSDENTISHDYVTTLSFDNEGLLWIGTYNGLNMLNTKTEQFTYFKSGGKYGDSGLSTNYIWSLYITGDTVWVGSNGGMTILDKKDNRYKNLTPELNLYNIVVYGILSDESNHLWFSSNMGIFEFDPTDNSLKNYTVGDGLQSNQFSGGAYTKDNYGKIYFGGINGLNSFFPDRIKENEHIPQIVITDLKIHNKSATISPDGPLTKSVNLAERIELSHDQDVFSFEFASLDYSFPAENEFRYKLENFDSDWNYAGKRNFVMYTNLDPGDYIFRVIGSNNDEVWNETGTSIAVVITPPFWETWWFIAIIALSISGLTYFVISYRVKSILEIERLRTRIAADLHDDVGTKLTEISMLSDIVYHTGSEGNSELKMVRNIGQIARSLIDSMDDIIWLVNPKRDTLYELFLKLRDTYEDLLSRSNIIIDIRNLNLLEKIRLPMEKRKNLYLIFKEALSNSVKYSECTEIIIETYIEGKNIRVTLTDNGKGFDPATSSRGNGLNNMRDRAKNIKGELKIESVAGKGTTVDFKGKI